MLERYSIPPLRGNSEQLRDEICSKKLECIDSIRDPVWGDIDISEFELKIIDNPDFQRLRDVRQLGPTRYVYPGGNHDRFSHSLGSLYCAQRIIETCNKNSRIYPQGETIGPYPIFLARVSALLHDFAHIPFGHTLEDEGNLYFAQWKDGSRLDVLLGKSSFVAKQLEEAFAAINSSFGILTVLEDIKNILIAKEETDEPEKKKDRGDVYINKLPYPYVADIVGNTICADILDYVARDFYNVGILERYGDRFLRYFVVKPIAIDGPKRLMIAVVGKDSRVRPYVVSEAIDLLRRRLSLAEKVYFHRTKNAASAMIISAVANSWFYRLDYLSPTNSPKVNNEGSKRLLKLGDDELISILEYSTKPIEKLPHLSGQFAGESHDTETLYFNNRCKFIMDHWKGRNFYKPIYRTSYWPNRLISMDQVEKLLSIYSNPQERLSAEIKIEENFHLPEGAAILYCPSRKMGMKIYRAQILLEHGKIVRLEGNLEVGEGYPDEGIQKEITLIKSRHLALWGLYMFIAPEHFDQVDKADISDYCADLFKMPNDLDQSLVLPETRTKKIIVTQHAKRYSIENSDTPITIPELHVLIADVANWKGINEDGSVNYESFCSNLKNLRAGKKQ